MKFLLFVEGDTEHKALPALLKRWLEARGLSQRIGVKPVLLRGCNTFLRGVARFARKSLTGPEAPEIIAAVGLLDLYGPNFYPSHVLTADDRCAWASNTIEGWVSSPRFRMFFAVHEVEAWILSQPELLPDPVRRALPGIAVQPECVDFHDHPSALLKRLYRTHLGRDYKKAVDSVEFLRKLDPEVAYRKCPHLARMLDEMLRLARERL